MLKILTLNWDGASKLEKLYPSLLNNLTNIDYEWWIKDNASKDMSLDLIKSWNNDKINLIKHSHNSDNFSYGCNFLFKESAPKYDDLVLLLNNDIIFKDQISLKKMIKIIELDQNVGVVGAKLKFTNTNLLQHAGVVFSKEHKLPFHFRHREVEDKNALKNRLFQVVTGAVWLTKAQYYENICETNKSNLKGFDENFIWSFDDVDACLSIHYNMNKKIVYCGGTNIFHEESSTLKKNPVNKLFMPHNASYLKQKWEKRYILDRDMYIKDPKYNLY